ncbi:MAG: hypothetical protein RLN69_06740 [Woeseiaceae bacterium]
MEFAQKRFSNKTRFEFGDLSLRHTIADTAGSETFSVEYIEIPDDHRSFTERNPWFRNVGMFWVLIGLFMIIGRYMDTGELRGSLWLTLGIVCFIVFWVARTSYTIFSTQHGRIFVIQNASHDAIVNEIRDRKRKQLRRLYGEVDLSAEPNKEIEKFRWLLNHGAVSEDEFIEIERKIRDNVESQDEPKTVTPPRSLN